MMDNSTKQGFGAGQAVGKNQEKGAQLTDKAGQAAISAKDSAMGAGKVAQDKAQEGVEYVKGTATKK